MVRFLSSLREKSGQTAKTHGSEELLAFGDLSRSVMASCSLGVIKSTLSLVHPAQESAQRATPELCYGAPWVSLHEVGLRS